MFRRQTSPFQVTAFKGIAMKSIKFVYAAGLLVTATLLNHALANPPEKFSTSADNPGRKFKTERIRGFDRGRTLPVPVSGVQFEFPSSRIRQLAESDVGLAYALTQLSRQTELGFTGAGGGMVVRSEAIKTVAESTGLSASSVGKRLEASHLEWAYSAKLEDATFTNLQVMVRDITNGMPIEDSTRVFEFALNGNMDALKPGEVSRKR
jgi:hypothetical protein